MKKNLRPILLCLGAFLMTIYGCQKQDQPVKPSSSSSNENKSNGVNEGVGHSFDNTFTKYINNYPFMTGIVGGDVGTGIYAGEVLNLSVSGDIMSVEALYHFNGGVHSFTAHVFVTENDAPGVGTATIIGNVTEGWLKGAHITGEYTVYTSCPIPTPGNQEGTKCYQGMIHIHVPKG